MRLLLGKTILAAVLLLSVAGDVRAQGRMDHSGSWIWVNVSADDARQSNSSTLAINNNQRGGRYCYNDRCWNVQFARRGNLYTFSTDGTNFFEFGSPEPSLLIGRAWINRNNPGAPPDAVIAMQER